MEEIIPNFPISYLEYSAEEVLVEIIPLFRHPELYFISYTIGPMESGIPIEVPLWFAITLKKRGKCKIRIPDWLSIANLERLVKEESSEHQRSLSILPFAFIELSNFFLTYCHEEMEQSERVSALIQDLTNIRDDRIRLGVRSIAETVQSGSSIVSTNLQNVSSMEIFSMRQFFLGAMDAFLWLQPPSEDPFLFGGDVMREEDAMIAPGAGGVGGNTSASGRTLNNNSSNARAATARLRKHRK